MCLINGFIILLKVFIVKATQNFAFYINDLYKIKIDWSGSAVLLKWKKKLFFLSTKIKPSEQKLYANIKLIFIFNQS